MKIFTMPLWNWALLQILVGIMNLWIGFGLPFGFLMILNLFLGGANFLVGMDNMFKAFSPGYDDEVEESR